MKIQTIAIAAALLTGTAFAAAPSDASSTTSTTTTTANHKHHKTVKTAHARKQHPMHHAMHHAAAMDHGTAMGASAPQTDVNDSSRESRMEDALAKYRQSHS